MVEPVATRLGNVVNFKRGYDLPESARRAGRYPVISSAGISGYHDEYKVRGEGLVTGRYGTLGEMHYYNGEYWPHNTALYVTDFKGNVPKYVYYLLTCLGRMDTGDKSAVPGVNRNDLHELKIPVITDKPTQKKIAEVLSELDAKIELNNCIDAELEALVKSIYDYWFVQFDFPDANGHPYKTSGGAMVWNDTLKREIPLGWNVISIGEACDTILGGTPDTKNPEYWDNADIPWLSSGETARFPVIESEQFITPAGIRDSAARLLPAGTVVVSIVRYIRPSILGIPAATNQSVVGILQTDLIPSSYLYPAICREVPRWMGLRTGAQQPHINKATVDETSILQPAKAIIDMYRKVADPLFQRINVAANEIRELIQLRDWLLPLLMNGQVRVANRPVSRRQAAQPLEVNAVPV